MERVLLKALVAFAAVIGLGVAATEAGAESQSWSPELQALIKAAQAEKTLNLSWAPASIGGSRGAARAQDEMNKMFGTNVEIDFTPGGTMPAASVQLAQEYAAKQPAFTDVFLGAGTYMSDLAYKYDVFQPAPFVKYLPGRITDEIAEHGGRGVKIVTSLAGVSYNTSVIPAPPRTLADLLSPAWKGKIGSTPYAAGFDQLGAAIGIDATLDFTRKLSSQLSGLLRCNEAQRIASGEFGALVFDCNPHYIDKAKTAGAPVDFAFIKELNTVQFFYLGVPKNAPHPNLAKLYIVYIETPEGQRLLWDTWQTNLHLYPETQVHQDVAKMEATTGKPKAIDLAFENGHPELSKLVEDASKILSGSAR